MHPYVIEKLMEEREREIAARAEMALLVPASPRVARRGRPAIRLALPRIAVRRAPRVAEVSCHRAAAMAGGC